MDVAAEPNRVSFRELPVDEKLEQTLTLSITDPKATTISKVTLDDEHFAVVPVKSEEPGKKRYEVAYRGNAELGRITGNIRVDYTGPDGDQHVLVPLWAQVVGELRYPNSLFFGKRDDAFESRKLAIATRSGKPVRILGAKDPEGRLDVKILTAQGATTELELSVNAAHASIATARGNLEIRTSDRREPKLTIPYTVHGGGRGKKPTLRRPRLGAPARKGPAGKGATPVR